MHRTFANAHLGAATEGVERRALTLVVWPRSVEAVGIKLVGVLPIPWRAGTRQHVEDQHYTHKTIKSAVSRS